MYGDGEWATRDHMVSMLMAEVDYPLRARVLRSPLGRTLLGPWVTRRGLGLLIVLLSAASIGVATPLARLALDAGVDVVALMTIRYGFALLTVVAYLIWRRQQWRLTGRQLRQALGLALALGALSFAFFGSVRRIPVSLAALIYYTYPILVSLLAYRARPSRLHRRPHRSAFGGQTLSLAGLALILGLSWTSLDLAGVLMATFSAVLAALVYVFGDQLMRTVSPMVLNLYVALVNAALFAVIGIVGDSSATPADHTGWVGLIGAAFFFVVGFMGMFGGITLLGPSRAACLKNFEPVFAVGLSIVLLGESYGLGQLIGAATVVAGIVTGCHGFWGSDGATVASQGSADADAIGLADCTPVCRLDSRCLLT